MTQRKIGERQEARPARSRNNTERKRAEEGAQPYAEIIKSMPVGLDVWHLEDADDPGSFRLILSNPAAAHFTGVPREDVLGKTLAESYPATLAIGAPRVFEKVIRSGKARHLGEVRYGDERIPQAVFSLTAFPLPNNCVGLGFENITERKQAEEALRTSEATYREIFNAATDGIIVLDIETGEIVDANATFLNVFEYTTEEAQGLRVGDFSSGTAAYTQEDALRLIRKAARGQPQRFEWLAKSRDGRLLWIDVTVKRATIAGRDRVLAIGRDITERKRAEEALRETTQTLQALIQASPLAIITVDLEGNVRTWNLAAERIFGWSEQEALGHPNPIIPEDRQDEFRANLDAVLQGNLLSQVETRRQKKDGSLIDVSLSTAAMRNATGDIIGTMGIIADITERKQAEEALRESEERFRKLSDATFEGIAIHRKGTILEANQALATMFGYELSDVIDMHAVDLTAPKFRDSFSQTMASGSQKPFETVGLRRDGTTFPCEIWCKPMPWQGRMVTVAALRDITERKRAEEALRESENRFRTLSEAGFEGIAIHDKGTIVDGNQTFASMFRYELSETIEMHVMDFVAGDSRELVLHHIVSKYPEPFEFTGLRKDGLTFPVEVCGRPIPYQGKLVTVAALRDLTERKQMEEALDKAREDLEARVERQMERGDPYGLTFRELTVLHVVAAGKADKEIAVELGISPLTASKHLANILSKMGAASRTEAGVRALREGLLD